MNDKKEINYAENLKYRKIFFRKSRRRKKQILTKSIPIKINKCLRILFNLGC